MLNYFLKGIGFGLGLALSIVIVSLSFNYFQSTKTTNIIKSVNKTSPTLDSKELQKWNLSSFEEKIETATAVVIYRFKKGEDDLNIAYVDNIFKRNPEIKLDLVVDDKSEKLNYYSEPGMSDRNGIIAMYIQNPAVPVQESYLYKDRLIGQNNMPLNIFLKKYQRKKD